MFCICKILDFLNEYHDAIEVILFVSTIIFTIANYNMYKKRAKRKVLSEYNIRYSDDRNIRKVVRFLTNNRIGVEPTAYEIEMFLRFFEEIQISINTESIDKLSVFRLFSYYCLALFDKDNNELLEKIEYKKEDWKLLEDFKKLMIEIRENIHNYE